MPSVAMARDFVLTLQVGGRGLIILTARQLQAAVISLFWVFGVTPVAGVVRSGRMRRLVENCGFEPGGFGRRAGSRPV